MPRIIPIRDLKNTAAISQMCNESCHDTDRADRELSDILEYLSVQLQNPTAATAFVEEVLSVYEALKHTPYMYELSHNLRLHRMGYHKVVIKNYVMLYRVDEQTQCVYVLHFFYGARQYEKLI